jgi:hypothetical protein
VIANEQVVCPVALCIAAKTKAQVQMSEYPYSLDKAALKFILQDRKISQNVSVKFAVFLLNFLSNNCRFWIPLMPMSDEFHHFMHAYPGTFA